MIRVSGTQFLHPKFRDHFVALSETVKRQGIFIFETFRSDLRQIEMMDKGTTRALPGASPHQWGLAADFVFRDETGWHWPDAEDPRWQHLRAAANAFGLRNHIAWDRPHVEVYDWRRFQDPNWRQICNATAVQEEFE